MRSLRLLLGGYFFFFSVWCIFAVFVAVVQINRVQDKLWILLSVLATLLLISMGAVLGVAWWSNLRKWKSARQWSIAASVLAVLILIAPPLFFLRADGWDAFCRVERFLGISTAIGIAFLVFSSTPDRGSAPHP